MPRRPAIAVVLLAVAVGAVAAPALGHVPAFSADNDDPGNATYVEDPAKSWSFYDDVDANESAYYETYLRPGDRLLVNTFTPRRGEFQPGFVVMSASLNGTAGVPDQVEVPEGYGARVVEPEPTPTAEYEPFTPAALHRTSALDTTVDAGGTYYVAVYDPDRDAGRVGVVVGHTESFTPAEYVTVPIERPRIHDWEGQPAALVYGPFLVGVLATAAVAHRRIDDGLTGNDARTAALVAAAALYVASTLGVVVQTVVAVSVAGVGGGVLVTLAFVGIPAALAWLLLGSATDGAPITRRRRAAVLAAAALGVATWAGFVVGPALAAVAAVLPE